MIILGVILSPVMSTKKGACTVVLGGQWGDEGKGKLVDLLAVEADMVCRCQVNHGLYIHVHGIYMFMVKPPLLDN